MSKLLLTALTLVLIAAGATVVLAATGDGSPGPAAVDLSGPCDEAEHATDPACAGAGTTAAGDDRGDDRRRGRDHAEDDGTVDDNSGPSANSGPGSVSRESDDSLDDESGDDNSGPSGGDDD